MKFDDPPSTTFISSENEKLKSEMEAFYKFLTRPELHTLLYEIYVNEQMKTLEPEEQEKLKSAFGHEVIFKILTNCFPGFLRYVRTQVRKLKWYQTQIKELAYLITLDLLYGRKSSLKKAKEAPKLNIKKASLEYERVTERTRRRFFHNYPELLSKPLRDVMHDLDDKREQPFNSIYTAPSTGQIDPAFLASIPFPLGKHDLKLMFLQEKMMPLHTMYRMVEPYDTEEVIEFHKYLQKILPEIITQYGPPLPENQWIKKSLEEGTLVEDLYQTIMRSVLRRWFRKKRPSTRENLLHEKHPLRYTRKDAENAVKWTKEWIQNPTRVFDIIIRGVKGLNVFKKPEAGVWLYQECLKQLELESEDLGLCYHNLAIQYRDTNRLRKYKINLLKAMKVWEDIESQYDIAVTWAFLAHAYFLEGDISRVEQAKEKAMSILGGMSDNNYRLSWGYIHLADCARWINDVEWEIRSLSKGFEYASNYENDSFFDYYNGRLIAINRGEDPLQLEFMGLLRRPTMTPWQRIGTIFSPILPNKDTKTA